MQNFMKTILNAIKTWTKVEIQQSKEETKEELNSRIKNSAADWNENDSAADSYVKNRTHWEEVEEAVIIPETTATIPNDGGYETLSGDCPMLTIGQTYIVILNGVRYECVARDYGGGVIIGNGTICGDGKEGNGEPFAIDSYGGGDIYLNVAVAGEYTVSIYNYQRVVHKLDSKYLPEYDGMVFEDDLNPVAYSGDYHDLNNIDTELSETSNNAVSNSIITAGINERLKLSDLNLPVDDIDTVWSSVCYGDGKFVAIARERNWTRSDKAAYSIDGVNWMGSTMPSSAYWSSICYGNGKFVAISSDNKAIYSADGVNWMGSTMPSFSGGSARWDSVCYGNGKFVAMNSTGGTAYSIDGVDWIKGYTYGGHSVCCYGDGKFVSVRMGTGQSHHSTDGVNWEISSQNIYYEYWSSICYGNGKFVAISSDSNKAIYSADGVNWMGSTMPSSANWSSICYGNDKFVAISSDSNKAAYSTDGVNWVESTMPSSAKWRSVCYGNGKFVAISSDNNLVIYSIDGIAWENKAILKCNEDVAEDVAMVVKPYLKDTIKYHINNPRFTLTLTDEVNGLDYIVSMRHGNLTTHRPTKSIAVTTMPNKTEYLDNDEFDPDGMVVMATDLDGSTREISNYSYNSVINHNDIVSEDGSCKFPITYIEGNNIFKTTVDLNVVYLGDFEYIENDDGTYTLTDWKGIYSGKPSTKIIVPNSELIIV